MSKLLYNANIIVGENEQIIENGYIIFDEENNKIIEVGKDINDDKRNSVDQSINLKGKWVLPGLINGHVHIMRDGSAHPDALIQNESMEAITLHALKNAKRHLDLGVTTVRDLGATGLTTLAVRDS